VPLALRLVRKQHEAENATSFYFQPDPLFAFQAGQYLRYTLPHSSADDRGVTRSFTIASSPTESLVGLTTRLSTPSSTFKQALARLELGAVIAASGPFGRFVYSQSDTSVVLIAGGIGITPFRSILGDLASRNVRASVTLLYSNRTPDIPFRAVFDRLGPGWPELHIVYTVTRPSPDWHGLTGRIDGRFICQHVSDLSRPLFYVSGPTPLVDALRAVLAELDIDRARVKHEAFPGYGG
jgi:ferredoxin-NADP reductase